MSTSVVRGRVTFGTFYLGGNNAAHGGTVTLLFDEVLGIMANSDNPPPPRRTAYLTVNYRKITPIGVELRVEASVDRTEGRKRWATGRLFRGDQLVADAEGLFVKLRAGQP
ncbi:PaaI family thioesterase [Cryptosporangium sp. NPDC051539]|uniref:PaaI family thioesterase n=1 Tax=Cryptosporangium sp. NPDC051539 TaxID=3363962 RepID=UPI0037A68080